MSLHHNEEEPKQKMRNRSATSVNQKWKRKNTFNCKEVQNINKKKPTIHSESSKKATTKTSRSTPTGNKRHRRKKHKRNRVGTEKNTKKIMEKRNRRWIVNDRQTNWELSEGELLTRATKVSHIFQGNVQKKLSGVRVSLDIARWRSALKLRNGVLRARAAQKSWFSWFSWFS